MSILVLDLVKNHKETKATKDGDFVIHAYRDTLMLADARNFNKRGKNCKITYFKGEWWDLKQIIEKDYPTLTLPQLFDGNIQVDGLTIRDIDNNHPKLFTEDKLNSFGKMTTKGINKLKETSTKIDKTTFLKLMASNKVTSIEQVMKLTDDYAFDASRDFCKGNERSIKSIVDDALSSSGFRCYVENYNEAQQQGTLVFSIHSNNYVHVHYCLVG